MPSVDQASALVAGLPFEIASQVRQFVVPSEVAASALLSAHMIIFWLSQDSNVTPPVCLAAFTAAAIAAVGVLALACGLACLWPFSLEINVLGLIATVALLIYNRRGPSFTVPVGHG